MMTGIPISRVGHGALLSLGSLLLLARLAEAKVPDPIESGGKGSLELAQPGLSEKEGLSELLSAPQVELGSRRAQSIDEANVSISVITERDIELSGATNLAELMRLIPGSHVIQGTANHYSVGFRGISRPVNNRMMILLNGIPQVRDANGNQLWGLLAVQPADIERIEVIRGPSSTLFGGGAMSGVVNIVTKRPLGNRGLEASAWGQLSVLSDSVETDGPRLRNGGGTQLAYNWGNASDTLGMRFNFGFNDVPEWVDALENFHGPFQYAAMTSLEWRPRSDVELFATLSHLHLERKVIENVNVPNLYHQNQQTLLVQLTKRELFIPQLSFRLQTDVVRDFTEFAAQLPADALDVIRRAGEGALEAWNTHSAALFDLTLWDGRSTTTFGAEAWLPFLAFDGGQDLRSTQLGVIFGTELKLLDRSLILSASARYDAIAWQSDGTLGDTRYDQLSPRAGIVWSITPGHALRLTGSSAFHTPTATELLVELFLPSSSGIGDAPPVRLYVGNPRLEPERLSAIELGYRGQLGAGLKLDTALFAQRVTDLISDTSRSASPSSADNAEDFDQLGLELSLQYHHSRRLSGQAHYTFVYSADAQTNEQLKDWPVHIGGIGLSSQITDKLRASLNTYMVFDYRPRVTTLDNLSSLPFSVVERRSAPPHAFINLRFGHYLYQAEIFVVFKNILGFFLDDADLVTYPRAADPIGGTLMLGLEIEGL